MFNHSCPEHSQPLLTPFGRFEYRMGCNYVFIWDGIGHNFRIHEKVDKWPDFAKNTVNIPSQRKANTDWMHFTWTRGAPQVSCLAEDWPLNHFDDCQTATNIGRSQHAIEPATARVQPQPIKRQKKQSQSCWANYLPLAILCYPPWFCRCCKSQASGARDPGCCFRVYRIQSFACRTWPCNPDFRGSARLCQRRCPPATTIHRPSEFCVAGYTSKPSSSRVFLLIFFPTILALTKSSFANVNLICRRVTRKATISMD